MSSTTLNRWDIAKLIGLALMFIDHSGAFFYTDQEWLRGIGRGTAPIFLFLTGLAAHYRFSRELFVLAVVLTVSDWLVKGGVNTLNILWTILLCRLVLNWLEKHDKVILPIHYIIMCIVWIPSMLVVQYGSLGFLLACAGYMYKHSDRYDATTPQRFLKSGLAIYGVSFALLSEYEPHTLLWLVLSLSLVGLFLHSMAKQIDTSFNAPTFLKYISHYSGYIYVIHLIALGWLTGIAL